MAMPRVVVCLTILCVIGTTTCLKVTKKSHTLHRNSLRNFDREDGRLLYVACKRGYTIHEKKCQVIGETSIERPGTHICNVTLTTSKQLETINPEVTIQRLGQDRAILFWQVNRTTDSELYSVISVVRLETCEIGEIRLDYKSALDQVFFVPRESDFEVLFQHSEICGNDMCRMLVDDSGTLIDGPEAFFRDHDEPYLLKAISNDPAEKGYFYVKQVVDETFYILIKPDGSQKILSQLPGQPEVYASTKHDWITACATYDGDKKYINCTQYDVHGNFEFSTQLKKTTVETQVKFVYNVRVGGFFLAYSTLSSCQTTQSCIRNLNNLLAKFDTGGKLIANKMERKTNHIWDSMFENEKGDYCVFKNSYIADNYVKKDGRNRMRITHDCYDDNDFSR